MMDGDAIDIRSPTSKERPSCCPTDWLLFWMWNMQDSTTYRNLLFC